MTHQTKRHECILRASRTFLQTACGVLTAVMTAAVTETVPQIEAWKTVLLTLLASGTAAAAAAVMNCGGRAE